MENSSGTRRRNRLLTLVVAASLVMAVGMSPALAAEEGTKGPCGAGTELAGRTLGEDVSFVARFVGTPLPQVFAFEEGPPPMPPGQLLQFARDAGLC